MAQYVFVMNAVTKLVPPKRLILRDISLSFLPGAKIGVLGLNGSGKSTLLRIMAGVEAEFDGEARPQPDIRIGFLPQEPELDPTKSVRGNVEESAQSIQLGDSRFIPLLKMSPKTSSKFALLGYYIRQHLFSYSLGVVAILVNNCIAVSIQEYLRLSIDLLNNDL